MVSVVKVASTHGCGPCRQGFDSPRSPEGDDEPPSKNKRRESYHLLRASTWVSGLGADVHGGILIFKGGHFRLVVAPVNSSVDCICNL